MTGCSHEGRFLGAQEPKELWGSLSGRARSCGPEGGVGVAARVCMCS
jgi:hypothetical protein